MTFKHERMFQLPEFTGINCYMMPIIQGDSSSLPDEFKKYGDFINNNIVTQVGDMGRITIDESFVEAGVSQRGYSNNMTSGRTIHVEACRIPDHAFEIKNWNSEWGNEWGRESGVRLHDHLEGLIANSIDDTCLLWDEMAESVDGDLSHRADEFPISDAYRMKANEVVRIGIFTPHEPVPQLNSGNRTFVRIMGPEMIGTSPDFTFNNVLSMN